MLGLGLAVCQAAGRRRRLQKHRRRPENKTGRRVGGGSFRATRRGFRYAYRAYRCKVCNRLLGFSHAPIWKSLSLCRPLSGRVLWWHLLAWKLWRPRDCIFAPI